MKKNGKKITTYYQGNCIIKQEVTCMSEATKNEQKINENEPKVDENELEVNENEPKECIEVLKDTPPQKKRGQKSRNK